ncbi:MAG: F0F1 ATP synthase subunit A [Peptostreptococcaceae bacterium]|jgi:F-type H+-transporting ATPase subunit a|nr:F0F1 ATP synthase subunit A [Peptostreptococcaceae bacterium]
MGGISGPKQIFFIPGTDYAITETIVTTWGIMLILIIASYILGKSLKKVPDGKQNFAELLVDGIYKLVDQTMGEDKRAFAPYIGTLMVFLIFANLSGLFGVRPPTADVNTTFALAIITFVLTHYFGARKNGVGGYLKGFLEPIPALLPLNIIGELANPISLSFRLFGNIVGGLIIMQLLYGALGLISIIPIPAMLHMYFDVFSGVLQSFIFSMLTMVFIAMAMD